MRHLLHHDYNSDGQRHADVCVRPRAGPVPLRYPDFTPTGFHVSGELALRDGSCRQGQVRLDHHEILSTPDGELCFHRGGRGYADAANVKYGHVALADLLDDPGRPVPAGGHRGAPAPLPEASEPLVVAVRSIPAAMHYKSPLETRSGSNRGASFLHYGDPGADQGDRHDLHYNYLLWSFLNAHGGGMVRALLRDVDVVTVCDVPPIAMHAYDEAGAVNGRVEAVYVCSEQAGTALYGWTVSAHELFGDGRGRVEHLQRRGAA
jgi:hypothetical protein